MYYIETSPRPHRVILYTKTDRMEFTASLSDILKQDKRLVQCVVRLQSIQGMLLKWIEMKNRSTFLMEPPVLFQGKS